MYYIHINNVRYKMIHLTYLQDTRTQLVRVIYFCQSWLHQQQHQVDRNPDKNILVWEPHPHHLLLRHSWVGLPPTWTMASRDLSTQHINICRLIITTPLFIYSVACTCILLMQKQPHEKFCTIQNSLKKVLYYL